MSSEFQGSSSDERFEELVRRVMEAISAKPHLIPERFMGYMVDYLAVNQPMIPVSQVFGLPQFLAKSASDASLGTTSSSTYGDLGGSSVGPTITGLSNGQYIYWFGALIQSDATTTDAQMTPFINGVVSVGLPAQNGGVTEPVSLGGSGKQLLGSGDDNTITLKYLAGGSPGRVGTFSNRWIHVLRVANA